MGAEVWHSSRGRTPSRLSNCGAMVAESVLQQLEAELMLHAEEEESETEMEIELSPGGGGEEGGGGARTLLVGVKLNATCREMLAWTIVELARRGDRIVAFHVAPTPLHSVATSRECEEHFEHLAKTLRGYLEIYEGLCLLKKIKLEVEIIPGVHVEKVLVAFAKAQKTKSTMLILGSNKLFSVRRNKSLGRYCLKRLPCTCSVIVLQHGQVILNENGRCLTRATDLTSIGVGVMKTLRRGMLSFGRAARKHEERDSSSSSMSTPRLSHAIINHSAELEMCYFSDSSLCHSSLIHEFLSEPDHHVTERADMFMLEDQEEAASEPETPGWPLMLDSSKRKKSTANRLSFGIEMSSCLFRFSPEKEKLLPADSAPAEIMVSSRVSCDRRMSVTDWALQLPHHRNRECEEEDYVRMLGEIARDAFVGEIQVSSSSSFRKQLRKVSKCVPFLFEELEAATSGFSSCNVVGHGGGSKVYKGMLADGKLVAVKRLNCGPGAEEELLNDVTINTSISHPNVVALLGYCVGPGYLILVYDYLPEGNLEDRLHAGTKAPVLPWHVRYKAAVGIAKALDYLHHGTANPIIHRDVKASNILLTVNFESQLSDFGLSKWAPKKASHILCDHILGTFGYLAPEYFMYGRVNNKTDVYAFGVVLLELITGRIPIDNTRPKGHENLVNWARPLLKENAVEELVDPRLAGIYDGGQMNRLLHAASVCVEQSSRRRPPMTRVLQIICSTHHDTLPPIRTWPKDRNDNVSMDLEDCDINNSNGSPTTSAGSGGSCASSNDETRLALAMVDVDNIIISTASTLDHCGDALLKYPEAYRANYLVK